jgi:predicted dehydrogenase
MVALAREKKLLLMESFMFKYHSQHDYTWDILNKNELGDLRLIRSQFGFPPLAEGNFRYDSELGGGALLDAAAYTVKAAQWFLSSRVEVQNANLYLDKKSGVDLYGNATLINESGLTAQISFGFDNFYQCNYEIWGSKGRLFAERAFTPKPNETPVIVLETQGLSEKNVLGSDNHFKKILMEFHRSIINNAFEKHYQEILEQSIVLSQIKNKAKTFFI